jgi:hypothetical protein
MKKVIFKYLSVFVAIAITGCSSDDKTIDKVFDEVQTGAFLRFVSTSGGALNKNDVSSSASVTFEFDGQDASMLSSVDATITFIDNDDTDGVQQSFGPIALGSISKSEFTTSSFGLPEASFSYTLAEALAAGGLTASEITGGDRFILGFTVTLTDGRTFGPGSANGNVAAIGGFYSSPYAYTSLVVCPPQPGVWTIEMVDTYGDGWQTATGGGGPGITFALNDGTVFEVSLCSAYGPRPGCTDDYNSGTATVTIPVGTSSMVATFPGDYYGEIEFRITSPTGNVLADYATGSAAGPIDLDFCNDSFN